MGDAPICGEIISALHDKTLMIKDITGTFYRLHESHFSLIARPLELKVGDQVYSESHHVYGKIISSTLKQTFDQTFTIQTPDGRTYDLPQHDCLKVSQPSDSTPMGDSETCASPSPSAPPEESPDPSSSGAKGSQNFTTGNS